MIERTETEIMKNWKGDISSPVASICSRTYNLEHFVSEALDSFLMQETDFPFEVVIDDDCSSDKTAAVIMKYMKKFPNIIKANLRKKNVGLKVNFVKNLQRAKGNYIALCDADDYWTDPLKLKKQVDFLEKNNEYVLTYTLLETFREDDIMERNPICGTGDKESLEIQQYQLNTGTCTVCFRNVDIIQNYPFEYHCAPSDDNFLWSLLGGYGKGKFLKDIKAVKYRLHSGGDSTSRTAAERTAMHIQTANALYMYYLRIGNIALSNYYYTVIVNNSIMLHGRWYLIKIILKGVIGGVLQRVKKIFNITSV